MIKTYRADGKTTIEIDGNNAKIIREIMPGCNAGHRPGDCIFVVPDGMFGAHMVFTSRQGTLCGIAYVSRYATNIEGPVEIPTTQKSLGRGKGVIVIEAADEKQYAQFKPGKRLFNDEYLCHMDEDRMKFLYRFVMDYVEEARENMNPEIYTPGNPVLDTGSDEFFSLTPPHGPTNSVLMYAWQPHMNIHMVRIAKAPRSVVHEELPKRLC